MNVSVEELKQIEASLQQMRTPLEFKRIVQALSDRIPSTQIWQDKCKFLREGINASNFATALNCEKVRLCDDRWPDFEIELNGVTIRYELIEAMEKDRRRGDEDWTSTRVDSVPVEEWRIAAEMIPGQ
jgi:hypothetical protein